ncbi:MAG: helix-turn-helix transcriptional regulator [Leptolyngbyaceae cyanobacterium bins.59]|nr:helix-turn-helix transcriptional regulator [Leptolyngbyaceae cyanobacterium bins.59]
MPHLPAQQPAIGQFIRELRQAIGLTQKEFGNRLGVSGETVSRWEKGRMQPSSLALKQLERVVQESGAGGMPPLGQEIADSGAASYGSA